MTTTAKIRSAAPSKGQSPEPVAIASPTVDRRPDRQAVQRKLPDERRSARRSAPRRSTARRAGMLAGDVGRDDVPAIRPGRTNSASATGVSSRPSRARTSVVSSHACRNRQSRHHVPLLLWRRLCGRSSPGNACRSRAAPMSAARWSCRRHRMAGQRCARRLMTRRWRSWSERAAAIRAGTARECVWLLEHPPLFTAGTSADPAELHQPARAFRSTRPAAAAATPITARASASAMSCSTSTSAGRTSAASSIRSKAG